MALPFILILATRERVELKEKWPQHFTIINHVDYVSQQLAAPQLFKKWLLDKEQFLLEGQPQPMAQ